MALNEVRHEVEDSHIHDEEEVLGIDSIACSLTNARAMIAARTHPIHLIMESPTTKERKHSCQGTKSAICGDGSPSPSSNLYYMETEGRNRKETVVKPFISWHQPSRLPW